jgi:uncharacterized protein YbbC (DUF1343 family)
MKAISSGARARARTSSPGATFSRSSTARGARCPLPFALAALAACAPEGNPGAAPPALAISAAPSRPGPLRAAPSGALPAARSAPARSATPEQSAVLTGIDVLERDGFRALRGRRIGLITNATGVDRAGRRTIDVLRGAPDVELRALFSPEHGLQTRADGPVADSADARTGLPIHSLYGDHRRPTARSLRDLDALVFDLQDAGARFFTYVTTLGYALEAASEHHLRMIVLDRPNPIGGVAVEGPLLDPARTSFTGYHPLPIRHGMTLGELARLFNEERRIGADLEIIRMEGWRRGDTIDRTGLAWIDLSPNLRSLPGAVLYPGVALIELTNVSVGRGTGRPFEQIGAPWIDGPALAAALTARALPGVRFQATSFTPNASTHAGAACSGVAITLVDPARAEPVKLGIALAQDLLRLHGDAFQPGKVLALLGNRAAFAALSRGEPLERVAGTWAHDLDAFLGIRRRYLLY